REGAISYSPASDKVLETMGQWIGRFGDFTPLQRAYVRRHWPKDKPTPQALLTLPDNRDESEVFIRYHAEMWLLLVRQYYTGSWSGLALTVGRRRMTFPLIFHFHREVNDFADALCDGWRFMSDHREHEPQNDPKEIRSLVTQIEETTPVLKHERPH